MNEELKKGTLFNIDLASPLGLLLIIVVTVFLTLMAKAIIKIVEHRLRKLSESIQGKWDDILVEVLAQTKSWALFFWILYPFVQLIHGQEGAKRVVHVLVIVLTGIQIAIWGIGAIRFWRDEILKKKIGNDSNSLSAVGLMSTALQGLFVIALVLICLSNLGVDIAALIAGLGVGGIAVALAAQNILGDLFGSLSIVLDKPFVVGDFIIVGSDMGTVENIGAKTTRVRSLSGEELIFANKDLLESRIKNYKRMWKRRAILKFGVTYDTPVEKLRQIPLWVQGFVEEEKLMTFERTHLNEYGDSSFNFEVVFWINDPDMTKFLDVQQELMLKLIGKFKDAKVDFAFPSRTIYMAGTPQEKEVAPII